eukprot:Tamp_11181.p1 GENE.Tamp_11181~~Tamp_11181.p1  ORF type:complete len:640 (-),score=84.96 Tamp_11181:27-1775(-)
MSEFVPSSDQRLSKAPSKHRAGDGFFPAASSTFKLFDETLNAQGGRGQDWGQDGKELAVTVAQDSVRLGPFQALHRFGTMAPRTASAFQDCDGVLGLAYSPAPDSASLLKSLFFPRRPSWNISEPRGREALTPHVFALLATEHGGELQLAGYDASAAVGGKVDFVDMSRDTYSVRISGMRYGGHQLLRAKSVDGPAPPAGAAGGGGTRVAYELEALFDTGSSCIELPDSAVGGLEASPFRALLDAHMRYGEQELEFELTDARQRTARVSLPYEWWTHPKGCLGPYSGTQVVLGDPVFRQYLVVHDLRPQASGAFQLGLGKLSPAYRVLPASTPPPPSSKSPSSKSVRNSVHFDGGGWRVTTEGAVKMGLTALGHAPARRYSVTTWVGTPAQALALVVDTASFLTQIYTCPPCRATSPSSAQDKATDSKTTSPHNKGTPPHKARAANTIASENKVSAKGDGKQSQSSHQPSSGVHAAHTAHAAKRKEEARTRLARKASLSAKDERQDRDRKHAAGDTAAHEPWHKRRTRGGFALGAVVVIMALVAVLTFAEWRRRDEQQRHRFRLVEYRTLHGQPSQFDFADL